MKIHAVTKKVSQAGAEHDEVTTVVVDVDPDMSIRQLVGKMREFSWSSERFSFNISVDGHDDVPVN